MENKTLVYGILITLQAICTLLMFFFGWLGSKMEMPDGVTYWWFCASMIFFIWNITHGILTRK